MNAFPIPETLIQEKTRNEEVKSFLSHISASGQLTEWSESLVIESGFIVLSMVEAAKEDPFSMYMGYYFHQTHSIFHLHYTAGEITPQSKHKTIITAGSIG